jgi:hypothetical protein
MDASVERLSSNVRRAESELVTLIAQNGPLTPGIEGLFVKYRSACQDLLLANFQAAAQSGTDTQLWSVHGRMNKEFRALLARFQEKEHRRKCVERRKTEERCLIFIKTSMRFYRGYIQRLASHFGGIPEVSNVALKLSLESKTNSSPSSPPLLRIYND